MAETQQGANERYCANETAINLTETEPHTVLFMGNQLVFADHSSLVSEISNLRYDKGQVCCYYNTINNIHYASLGASRFLKSIRAIHDSEGAVVLKVFIKPEGLQDIQPKLVQLHRKCSIYCFNNIILSYNTLIQHNRTTL